MVNFHQAEKIIARCRQLATISETESGTLRTFLSPAMKRCYELVGGWMREAGMSVRVDAAGNLRATRKGREPGVLLGSHLDTVRDAGAFDGILGVILAVEIAAESNYPFAVEVVGFSEEEGVRFRVPFIGSRALVGGLTDADLQLTDSDGITVTQAILDFGLDPAELPQAPITSKPKAFLEFHIEQGPVLDAAGESVGIVEAIAGQSRGSVQFSGMANHAGTTPMDLRRDALLGAAEWMIEIEKLARTTSGLVATTGKIEALPGASNVIPGAVTMSLDMRHASDSIRNDGWQRARVIAEQVALHRRLSLTWTDLLQQTATPLNQRMTSELDAAAVAVGIRARRMVSGAGHDAMILAPHMPTTMLFLRSPGGVSHHPSENVLPADVDAALRIGREFLRRLEAES